MSVTPDSSRGDTQDLIIRQESNLLVALDYAARGWPVLPLHSVVDGSCSCGKQECRNRGKHPRTLHGVEDATCDIETITRWWKQWTDSNVGIATGGAPRLVVIDVDPRHGGDESLAELERTYGTLPSTVETLTGGGGRHIFFYMPPSVDIGGKPLSPGLDVRGNGGYVVAPPSVHASGRTYQWEASSDPNEVSLAEIPEWIVMKLNERRQLFSSEDDTTIPEGQRNTTLTSLAGAMRRPGMSLETIQAALDNENRLRCIPPLDDDEVARIVASISKYPTAENLTSVELDLQFKTAQQRSVEKPPHIDWVIRDFAAAGAVTELDGSQKLSGKTTLVAHAVKAILEGTPFLGKPTVAGSVVWLTEESWATFQEPLLQAGIANSDKLYILCRDDFYGVPWEEVATQARKKAVEVGARLLVADTLSSLAGLKGDAENSSGDALEAVRPVQEVATAGIAVIVTRHDRRAGGEVGESGRGSTAFAGAMDMIFRLTRMGGDGRDNMRKLDYVGRIRGVSPSLVIRLTDHGYEMVGTEADVKRQEARELLLEYLPSGGDEAVTLPSLWASADATKDRAAGPLRGSQIGKTTFYEVAGALEREGLAARKAVTKNKHVWWLMSGARGSSGYAPNSSVSETVAVSMSGGPSPLRTDQPDVTANGSQGNGLDPTPEMDCAVSPFVEGDGVDEWGVL